MNGTKRSRGSLFKIPQQGTSVKGGGGRLPRALSSIGALCPQSPRYCPAAPSNDPNLPQNSSAGLRAPFTLQSWKCSDWSVSWISGSRFPGGCCCCCCCCEAEDEPAVRPSSTFLMLNFLMVSPPRGVCLSPRGPRGSGGTGWEGVRAAGGFDRGVRRSGEQKIIPTGRAATTGARRRVLFLRGRRGLQWRRTPPPHLVAVGLPPSRAAAAAAASMAPRPRNPSARPGLGLRSAQPPGPHGPDTRSRSSRLLPLSPRPLGRSLSPPGSLGLRPPTPGRAGGQPRFQRRPRRWRQLGLRGAGCPVRMRAAAPAPGPRLKSSSAEGRGSSWRSCGLPGAHL